MRKMLGPFGMFIVVLVCTSYGESAQGAKDANQSVTEYQQLVEDMNKNASAGVTYSAGSYREVRLPTVDEIRDLGDLWPTIPPAENAAFVYARAFAALTYPDEFPAGSVSSTERRPKDFGPLRRYVDVQSNAITFAKTASRMRMYQFPPLIAKNDDRDRGLWAHLRPFRQLARVLDDAALVAELDGKLDEDAELYLTCMRMGRHLQQGRFVDAMTGHAVALIGFGPLENLMASRDLSPETLLKIKDTCAQCEVSPEEWGQVVKREYAANCWLVAGEGWDKLKKGYEVANKKYELKLPDLPNTREEYLRPKL